MSVVPQGSVVWLLAPSRVEDAEPLVSLLLEDRTRAVDLSEAGFLHSAVVQALVVLRPQVAGSSPDPFIQTWLLPLLEGRPAAQTD